MKRLYQEPKRKNWERKRQEVIQRRLSKNNRKRKSGRVRANIRRYLTFGKNGERRTILVAPKNFSLGKNPREVNRFFQSLNRAVFLGQNIFIKLELVESISLDSLMYMVALFDFRSNIHPIDVIGDSPKASRVRRIVNASGFFDFVERLHANPTTKPDVYEEFLKISTGTQVDSVLIGEAITWAAPKLGVGQNPVRLSRTYEVLVECIANSHNHAYRTDEAVGQEDRWWLSARFDMENKLINFTVLDMGIGIYDGLRHNWKSIIDRIFKGRKLAEPELITAAFQGKLGSRTGLENRGKGLPMISDAVMSGDLEQFSVFTGQTVLHLKSREIIQLDHKMRGTMYKWSVSIPGVSYEVDGNE